MTIKPLPKETSNFLDGFSKMFASIKHLSLPDQRSAIQEMFLVPEDQLEPIKKVENRTIEGRNGPIPLRIYNPSPAEELPILLYLHRGGWVYGSLNEAEMIARRLANILNATVVSVEYRLSPEHKFPIPLEDCIDSALWTLSTHSKVIIAGESAGANLAAATALALRDQGNRQLAGQLLIYPPLTNDLNKNYYENSPDKSLLSYENMQFFWDAYLPSKKEGNNPYASPLKSQNLAKLPSCFMITAEHDALKTEGREYAEQLQKAGIPTQMKCYPDMIHGFLDLPLGEATRKEAFADIKAWMNSILKQ